MLLSPPMTRPILLGLINPYTTEALDVRPVGCSGYRLASFLREFTPLGEDDYKRLFDRRNLLQTNEDDPHRRAKEFKAGLTPGDQVVLLGEAVRRSLDLPKVLIHPLSIDGIIYRQIPHPSGLTRFYNTATTRWLVAQTLFDLVEKEYSNGSTERA